MTLAGRPAASEPSPGRSRTAVERSGRPVAWIEHRADLHAAFDLPEATARTAGLALERSALQAAQRLQERELHASTLRLVTAGETERRRLERDLHDGAQQRLLAVGLGLTRELVSAPLEMRPSLAAAQRQVGDVHGELRRIAHGIHSVVLAEGGLAEATLDLVEAAGGGITVDALPTQRAPAEFETAIYRVVAASLGVPRRGELRLAIESRFDAIDAALHVPGTQPASLTEALAHASARVAALGGSLTVVAQNDGAVARAHIPIP